MQATRDLFDPMPAVKQGNAVDIEPSDQSGSVHSSNQTSIVPAAAAASAPIAIPCGFSNRYNQPCRRLGSWPVIVDGSQMVCRGRPMVHCDPACFRDDVSSDVSGNRFDTFDDVIWEDSDESHYDGG